MKLYLKTTVPIVPCPRPRITKRGSFMPARYKECQAELFREFSHQYQGEILEGPVVMSVSFVTKNKRRGDVSNLLKTIEDVLEGLVYYDDIQITGVEVFHRKGTEDATYIEIKEGGSQNDYIDKVTSKAS